MYIYNVFPQFRSLAGGERLVLKLCEESIMMGHQIGLITLSMDELCIPQLNKKIIFKELYPRLNYIKNHYLRVFFEHLFAYNIAKAIPSDVDVVCFHKSSSLPALWYFKKIIKSNKPVVYYCYEPPRFAYDLQSETLGKLGMAGGIIRLFLPIFRFVDKRMTQAAAKILVFNNYMKNWIEGLYQKDVEVVGPLGVDMEKFCQSRGPDSLRKKWTILANDYLILTINKLHVRKRLHLLIQSMPKILLRIPNVKLLIVGTGPEEKKLKGMVQKMEFTKNIIFTGHIPDSDVPKCYAMSDLYVHLSKNEPFGLTVIEAQACGLPVITVKEGGPKDTVIENVTGLFCKPDVGELADKIISLLKNRVLRERMSDLAKLNIKNNYAWEKTTQKFLDVCQKVR